MNYKIRYTDKSEKHIKKFEKSGNKIILNKIDRLIEELKIHPRTGTGKPEQLKGLPDRWSRRITKKHRLVYKIEDDVVIVLVLSAYGHYNEE